MNKLEDRKGVGWAPRWWVVFLVGLGLWVAAVVTTGLTANANMIPTVVLLGSFLVPVTAVIWYLDHDLSQVLQPRLVINALIIGGVFGVVLASLAEAWLHGKGLSGYLGVGLIEELVKGLALAALAWRLPAYATRDGIVLGATVGFGFAALESSGYALTALLVQNGSLSSLVFTELTRGLLAPVGHGLWTAILGGVLFRAARNGRLRLTWGVVGTYLGVAVLHAGFDSVSGVAAVLTGVTAVGEAQVPVYLALLVAGFIIVSAIGVSWLVHLWRGAARREEVRG
jgi:protease PrsW